MPSYPTISITAPTTTLPVGYAHTIEYFEKGIDAEGPYYKVNYLIANWSDADLMANSLLGYTSISGNAQTGVITKRSPHQHPLSTNLFCRSARIKGVGKPVLSPGGLPSYAGGATLECEYRPMTTMAFQTTPAEAALQTDPGTAPLFCTQEVDLTTEMYTIPNTQLRFRSTTRNVPVPFRLHVPVGHLQFTFHKLAYNPWSGPFRALRGKVNSGTFLGCDENCVLFKSAKIIRDWDESGNATMKLMLTFSERPPLAHWNMLPDPTSATFAWAVVEGPGGASPYDTADLSPLLNF